MSGIEQYLTHTPLPYSRRKTPKVTDVKRAHRETRSKQYAKKTSAERKWTLVRWRMANGVSPPVLVRWTGRARILVAFVSILFSHPRYIHNFLGQRLLLDGKKAVLLYYYSR
jgi:hypothetical protein